VRSRGASALGWRSYAHPATGYSRDAELAPKWRQAVLDFRGLGGMHLPVNKAVYLRHTECLRQHLLTHAADEVGQLAEPIATL
jgi:hypothetical protein